MLLNKPTNFSSNNSVSKILPSSSLINSTKGNEKNKEEEQIQNSDNDNETLSSSSLIDSTKRNEKNKVEEEDFIKGLKAGVIYKLAVLADDTVISGHLSTSNDIKSKEIESKETESNNIKLWQRNGDFFELVQKLSGHSSKHVISLAVSPDGTYFASGGYDNCIDIWEKVNGVFTCTQILKKHSGYVFALVFKDNDTLVSASAFPDSSIIIWKKNTKFKIGQLLCGHEDTIFTTANVPSAVISNAFVSGSKDTTIKLWVDQGDKKDKDGKGLVECVQTINAGGGIAVIITLPDGSFVSGDFYKYIKWWVFDVNGVVSLQQTLSGHSSCVRALAPLKDGTFVSGGDDNFIIRWQKDENGLFKPKQTFVVSGGVRSFVVLPDGSLVSARNGNNKPVLQEIVLNKTLETPKLKDNKQKEVHDKILETPKSKDNKSTVFKIDQQETHLHLLIKGHQKEEARKQIEMGANLNVRNGDNLLPSELAEKCGDFKLADAIREKSFESKVERKVQQLIAPLNERIERLEKLEKQQEQLRRSNNFFLPKPQQENQQNELQKIGGKKPQ